MHNNCAVKMTDLIINSGALASKFRRPCEKSKEEKF